MPATLFALESVATPSFRFALYALVLAVGVLVGLEIPLVMRILKRHAGGPHGGLKTLVSQVLTFDYLGALAVSIAFPLVLVPQLGLIRTGALFGLMNAAVAVWALWLFRAELRGFAAHAIAALLTVTALVAAFAAADLVTSWAEDRFYGDRVIYSATSAYQRIVVTGGRSGHPPVSERQPAVPLARRVPLPRGAGPSGARSARCAAPRARCSAAATAWRCARC